MFHRLVAYADCAPFHIDEVQFGSVSRKKKQVKTISKRMYKKALKLEFNWRSIIESKELKRWSIADT